MRSPMNQSLANLLNEALGLHRAGKLTEAIARYQRALEIDPHHVDALRLLGMALFNVGKAEQAADHYVRALELQPQNPLLLDGLGDIRMALGQVDHAIDCYERSLTIRPGKVGVLNNLAGLYARKGRFGRALDTYQLAINAAPDQAGSYFNVAAVLAKTGSRQLAIEHYREAIRLDPALYQAFNNLATMYIEDRQWSDAIDCCEKACALRPDYAPAHYNFGVVHENQSDYDAARVRFFQALHIEPGNIEFLVACIHACQQLCDWHEIDGLNKRLIERLQESSRAPGEERLGAPFKYLTISDDPALNLRVARSSSRTMGLVGKKPDVLHAQATQTLNEKLRVGYLSGNFYQHPTLQLMSGVFREHDRDRFEVFYLSCSPRDNSELQLRLVADDEHFIDLNGIDDVTAARRINVLGLDVLIDLSGHSRNARQGICALRPAPVQLTYLAYPATTGVDFFDAVLTDEIALPAKQAAFFSEPVVYLTGAYHSYDDEQLISEQGIARSEFGLPDDAFVFCSFNQAYKLDRKRFQRWMNILRRCPRSVLWLYASSDEVRRNLLREAGDAGVEPMRLIFASALPKARHLRRLQLADLMLDTDLYNGHTTTMDALWAGLPVISRIGSYLPSRVSAAQLETMGMSELVVDTDDEYEDLALRLANDNEFYDRIRADLARNRRRSLLFDTAARTRELERIYSDFAAGKRPLRGRLV